MINSKLHRNQFSLFLLLTLFFSLKYGGNMYGQLCEGTKGDTFFYENFTSSVGVGISLPLNVNSFDYTTSFPEEDEYAIRSNTIPNTETLPDPNGYLWHLVYEDMSSILDVGTGKMLLMNAADNPGTYYRSRVDGLCDGSQYEFSFWLAPLYNINSEMCSENGGLGVPVSIRMEVWNSTETELLAFSDINDIENTSSVEWKQYGLVFGLDEGDSEVFIKLLNNNQLPGCGNDFALDEIKVELCGAEASISSVEYGDDFPTFCRDENPFDLTLQLNNNSSTGSYIWQSSIDGFEWENIEETITINGGGDSFYIPDDISVSTYFRVVFASSEENLLDDSKNCVWSTNVYEINIISQAQSPVAFAGTEFVYCGDSEIPALAAIPVDFLSVNWYDSPTGGNLLYENSFSFVPPSPGTYYAGYTSDVYPCVGDARTAFTLEWYPGLSATTNPDPYLLCGDEGIVLDALHPGLIYEWDPVSLGDEQTATVYEPGLYIVTMRDPNSPCDEARTRTFIVEGYLTPEISEIIQSGNNLIVTMVGNDPYEYSIDNINWQSSNIFYNLEPGFYTIYVRDILDCGHDSDTYFIFPDIPKFFTPNNDGDNDVFTVEFLEDFNIMIQVYDRYGKLITILDSNNPSWDGTYENLHLPSTDYWYKVFKDDILHATGHFTLKR